MRTLFALALFVVGAAGWADSPMEPIHLNSCTIEFSLTGTIGPASQDLLERALNQAVDESCSSVLMTINTPGGSLQTTRTIVETILNAKVPILCVVAPSGGHAGSAGAIILQACHVNGALSGTNIGAATPILATGTEMPEDLRKKLLNDTRSWMESITRLRGRSDQFGADIVVDAKAVSADDAKKLGAIDVVVDRVDEFLEFAKGREVKLSDSKVAKVEVGERKVFHHDWRFSALELLADPETSYLMLMGSLALIYFEITHPGTLVPGTLGGIGLILSMVALQKLNVEWGGFALLLLAVGLLIAEAFVPSFGILGIGGIASFIIGSLFLFDPAQTGGYRLPLSLILPTALLIGSVMLGVGILIMRSFRVRKRGGFDDMIGESGVVVTLTGDNSGQVEVSGETWKAEADRRLEVGMKVKIIGYKGLTLKVDQEV